MFQNHIHINTLTQWNIIQKTILPLLPRLPPWCFYLPSVLQMMHTPGSAHDVKKSSDAHMPIVVTFGGGQGSAWGQHLTGVQ